MKIPFSGGGIWGAGSIGSMKCDPRQKWSLEGPKKIEWQSNSLLEKQKIVFTNSEI